MNQKTVAILIWTEGGTSSLTICLPEVYPSTDVGIKNSPSVFLHAISFKVSEKHDRGIPNNQEVAITLAFTKDGDINVIQGGAWGGSVG